MKKSFVVVLILVLVIAFVVGYKAGSKAVLSAPKWVEEQAGLYIICTDFAGDVYEDVADKESQNFNSMYYVTGINR